MHPRLCLEKNQWWPPKKWTFVLGWNFQVSINQWWSRGNYRVPWCKSWLEAIAPKLSPYSPDDLLENVVYACSKRYGSGLGSRLNCPPWFCDGGHSATYWSSQARMSFFLFFLFKCSAPNFLSLFWGLIVIRFFSLLCLKYGTPCPKIWRSLVKHRVQYEFSYPGLFFFSTLPVLSVFFGECRADCTNLNYLQIIRQMYWKIFPH